MKGLKQILQNKITRYALLFTVFILFVYRLGSYIVIPGMANWVITNATDNTFAPQTVALFDFFGGGNLSAMSLFALGVSPYITASIVVQLLESDLIPAMSEWKHQGVDGQNKRSNWTKYLSIIFAFIQSFGVLAGYYLMYDYAVVADPTILGYLQVIIIMAAGSALVVWLSDRITENGVGNGVSVVISAGILSRIPLEFEQIVKDFSSSISTPVELGVFYQNPIQYFKNLYSLISQNPDLLNNIILWSSIFVVLIIVIIAVIYYTLASRKIPINYVRGRSTTIRENSYLPIKLNPAGVIPVIFVYPLFLLLNIGIKYLFTLDFFAKNGQGNVEKFILSLVGDVPSGTEHDIFFKVIYICSYGLFILLFSIFYSYVQMNPEEMTKNLEKQSAYIVNVRPGKNTLDYLTNTINRTSFWGGLFLVVIAIIPLILENFLNVNVSLSLLGTGLIIIISVIVQVYESLINKSTVKKYRSIIGE